MNAAVTNNNNNTVAAPLARRVSGGAARRVAALTRGAPCRATSMPGTPTTKLKDLKNCIEAQQFDAEMLKELFVVADAMAEVKPGSPESRMLQGFNMATLFYEPSTRTRLNPRACCPVSERGRRRRAPVLGYSVLDVPRYI